MNEEQTAVIRLSKDLATAATTMTDNEVRFLVDGYYIMQEDRKRTANQILQMKTEPHLVIAWLNEQTSILEKQIKRALGQYTDTHPVGVWMKTIFGMGPVMSAGLLAHIDITKAPTVGHIWSFAGLVNGQVWNKGEKRPWNATLKTLCWKVGQSFMKFSNADDCFYGHIYRDRKALEVERNESGQNKDTALTILKEKKIGKTTDAYKHLTNGKLPPAQLDARARRYSVKLFLSHMQLVWWFIEYGELPPKPYILDKQGGHAHMIVPPNMASVPGLEEAFYKMYASH